MNYFRYKQFNKDVITVAVGYYAVLMDLHDEWIYSSRKYINFDK
ncbi:hypothetical protein [Staphylococcus epidermidis]|nr:hypothetical protein [Staphylococcus epidermidis]